MATIGKPITRKQVIVGYRLHLVITMSGFFLDFEMPPANYIELATGLELLNDNTDLDVLKIKDIPV